MISALRRFRKAHSAAVLDIILFGSAVKGKEAPEDIDLLLIYRGPRDTDAAYALRKAVEALGFNADVTEKTWAELFAPGFWAKEGILSEGFSVAAGRPFCEAFGFSALTLFIYDFAGATAAQRTGFYHALLGRKAGRKRTRGILEEVGGMRLAPGIVAVPVRREAEFLEFMKDSKANLKQWLPALVSARLKPLPLRA